MTDQMMDTFRTRLIREIADPFTAEEVLEATDLTEEVLREHGNVSSVSVLVVLERWLASPRAGQAGYGLLSAFGPGFSAEGAVVRW